jgi:hypothetical protein
MKSKIPSQCTNMLPMYSIWLTDLCLTILKNKNRGQGEWVKQESLLRYKIAESRAPRTGRGPKRELPLTGPCLDVCIAIVKEFSELPPLLANNNPGGHPGQLGVHLCCPCIPGPIRILIMHQVFSWIHCKVLVWTHGFMDGSGHVHHVLLDEGGNMLSHSFHTWYFALRP